MHIHEIIIDGFKSYAQKTVISGFDPQFNAITGLNGTGKSNILDSICFVLGILNLSQVRVGNLQELVYKQGQAGITKASVTIVFNNADPASSPVGYESSKQITVTRQVVIGGKNKYMINGHTVQQSQVQNMFHSVQLNVNNPHFLIMQGRITKVLNMKPIEILSMIEEAAGTRMFETKKQAALKTIEKKQLKVDELSQCMNQEICPTLDNLRGERQSYVQWQTNNTELERLERFCIACEFKIAEEKVQSSDGDKDAMLAELQALEATQRDKQAEADDCSRLMAAREALRDGEVEGSLQSLKKVEVNLSKDLVKANTMLANQKETVASERDLLQSLTRQSTASSSSADSKKLEIDRCNVVLKQKESECAVLEEQASAASERFQNACAGVVEDSADFLSLPEQVGAWEKKAREAHSQLQQGELQSTHITGSLKELRKNIKTQQAAHASDAREQEQLTAQLKTAEDKLTSCGCPSAQDEAVLRSRCQQLRNQSVQLQDTVDGLSASLQARLNFEFKDPERNFNRHRVKGMVAKLVRVNDLHAAAALEIAAGAKLYQVVVDTEQTGKLILQKGELRKRVTILPLNKINNACTHPDKVMRAKQLAAARGGAAHLALELVGYDDEVRRAMEFVFGNVIICDNSDIAKAIAFDKNVRNRTVTLDGDSYDPAGTLTGGSKNQIGDLLVKIEDLASAQEQLDACQADLLGAQEQLRTLESKAAQARELRASVEQKQHALQICLERLAGTTYAQMIQEAEGLESQLKIIDEESITLRAVHTKAAAELRKLQDAEASSKKKRADVMKDMENHVKATAKLAKTCKAEVATIRGRRDALVAELSAITKELQSIQDQLKICESGLQRISRETDALTESLESCREEYEAAKAAVVDKQGELAACSKEIKSLAAAQDKCLKAVQAASLEARKITHKLKQWEKDSKDAAKAMTALLKQHAWIEREKGFFGQAGSDFDFAGKDVDQANKRLRQLKTEQEKLSKNINKKVMGMIEKAESEYEELRRKKEVILNDKAKIEAVIEELDVKKAQALQSTWIKVNRDFGSIFSMLLPGTQAKLEPQEGLTVMEGLEVKVAFNGVWKDSLTELSGGQRSLLALSLILSLLLFKPAPMYILDEVDAALDLSHTQNIGIMLRSHFSASQFIVVSLKEGMFNNANVIFRTRFVDGISAVTRTVVGGRSQKTIEDKNEDSEVAGPQKKASKSSSSRAH